MNTTTIVIAIMVCIVYAVITLYHHYQPKMICLQCGEINRPSPEERGNIYLAIFLWICFIVPGLLYSLWSFFNKKYVCPACRSERLVPPGSPAGKRAQSTGSW